MTQTVPPIWVRNDENGDTSLPVQKRLEEPAVMPKSYPEVTVFRSEARSLVSSIVGQEYRVPVWLPPGYAESERSFPVLYLLDANISFGIAADVLTLLVGREIPEIIVVGIGYPSLAEWVKLRLRDLHPTPLENTPGT